MPGMVCIPRDRTARMQPVQFVLRSCTLSLSPIHFPSMSLMQKRTQRLLKALARWWRWGGQMSMRRERAALRTIAVLERLARKCQQRRLVAWVRWRAVETSCRRDAWRRREGAKQLARGVVIWAQRRAGEGLRRWQHRATVRRLQLVRVSERVRIWHRARQLAARLHTRAGFLMWRRGVLLAARASGRQLTVALRRALCAFQLRELVAGRYRARLARGIRMLGRAADRSRNGDAFRQLEAHTQILVGREKARADRQARLVARAVDASRARALRRVLRPRPGAHSAARAASIAGQA